MVRALVTGGTGFTGSHLVRELVADGQRVQVIARSGERARALLPPEVEVVQGDITDPQVVGRGVRGQEVVYHLAAAFREAGIPDSRYHQVHVEATRTLLEAGRAEGVHRFVHCSTVGVHSHIENPPADESWPHTPGDITSGRRAKPRSWRSDSSAGTIFPSPSRGQRRSTVGATCGCGSSSGRSRGGASR